MKILKETIVSMPDAKNIMKERRKDGDLTYEQKICLEYLEKVSTLTKAKAEKMVSELSQIAILKPHQIALIINNLPDTEDEVKMVFAKERTNLKKDEISKIVEVVSANK